ncbi:cell wall hydrolase [Pseudomonas sp. 22526]|uniref:cell wall hydrolase n=1 Tax=Pseudomonas sp. 22526 TaxID=3453937 RepID=UPI003F828CC6
MTLQNALLCLALNIYHESRGEPLEGQIAVAMVTMNRASWETPNVCKVVYQEKQFSWTHQVQSPAPKEPNAWANARRVARTVIEKQHVDVTRGATHFHARTVRPQWRNSLKKTTAIGRHVFYAQK